MNDDVTSTSNLLRMIINSCGHTGENERDGWIRVERYLSLFYSFSKAHYLNKKETVLKIFGSKGLRVCCLCCGDSKK